MTLKNLSKKTKLLLLLTSCVYAVDAVIATIYQYTQALILSKAENGDMRGMFQMVGVTLLFLVLFLSSSVACDISRLEFMSDGTLNMKHGLMRSILLRPFHSFRKENNGYYLNLLSNDADTFMNEYLSPIPYMVSSVIAIVSSGFMLIHLNVVLFLFAVLFSLVPLFMGNLLTKPLQKLQKIRSEMSEQYIDTAKQTVDGMEAVRSSAAQKGFLSRFDASSKAFMKARAKYAVVNGIGTQTLYGSAALLNIVCLTVGGYLALSGELQLSMIFVAIKYYTSIANGFNNIVNYIVEIKATRPVREKLANEMKEEVPESAVITDGGVAEFDSVSFRFGERKLYEGFSHVFAKGSCTAVIGESGSGKSTLMKLLRKYYPDYEGAIQISGEEIGNLSEQEIYRHVGVVEQNTYLFNASLYDNITMFSGVPVKGSEEYRELLARFNLTALAAQVGETPLGDFGDKISGGERQRIALARTLRNCPELIIFDEPTTGLDPENVRLINDAIFSLDGITRIVISHDRREEFLQRFDDVVAL